MSNVEIYDSSNSQLSSDEYSHDEDDDALMDVAVSKQKAPTKKSTTKSETSSAETSPEKSGSGSSTATTSRKFSSDTEEAATSTTTTTTTLKPPATLEHTQRQIKQLQRNSTVNLYFKRRSIIWLNQRLSEKTDYVSQLQRAMPLNQEQAERRAEYLAAKKDIEREQRARQQRKRQQRRERTPSRSPSRSASRSRSPSRSVSPELICLDDTENEESPEKLELPEKPTAVTAVRKEIVLGTKTASPLNLQLPQATAAAAASPAENGNVLDEFLQLKPVAAVIEELPEEEEPQQLDLTRLSCYKAVAEAMDKQLEEASLKRRRSPSPPAVEPAIDKRGKTIDLDDDDLFELPIATQQAAAAAPTTPLQRVSSITTQAAAVAAARMHTDALQTPLLKLGSPFSLTPSSGMEFYNQQKALSQQPQQQQPISFSLETPEPQAEAMEISYPTEKLPEKTAAVISQRAASTPAAASAGFAFATPYALQQTPQQLQQQQQQQTPLQLQQQQHQKTPQQLQQPLLQTPQQLQQVPQQLQQALQQLQQAPQQLQQAEQTTKPPQMPQQPQQTPQSPQTPQPPPQMPQSPQQAPQPPQQATQQLPQQPPRSKQRLEFSKQTQTPTASSTRNTNTTDLNNSNSDAVFHQRVRELYTELDEIMTDKVRAVKPELKTYCEEKQRIEADIKTLDNLISQKEEEHNRLLHLRCIKEELLARIVRKERILVIKEILPSILNKNCSTSELYEMHSLLLDEQNAPMPSPFGANAMELMINRVETGRDDIKIWRHALGLQEKAPPKASIPMPPPHYEETQFRGKPNEENQFRRNEENKFRRNEENTARRHSVPSLPPPLPPVANYTRHGRSNAEDYRREQSEESPLLGRRNRPQPMQARYQQLINESRLLTSSPDLSASTSSRNYQPEPMDTHRSHPNLLENHLTDQDDDMPGRQWSTSSFVGGNNHRNLSRVNSNELHYPDEHSNNRVDLMQEQANRNNNNRSRRISTTTNGPEDPAERRCQNCERARATYMCAGCQNQWYCSRECQVHAWDTHWESCPN